MFLIFIILSFQSISLQRSRCLTDMGSKLPLIPDVKIDPSGDFKYILVRAIDKNAAPAECKFVVRGSKEHSFHDDIFQELRRDLRPLEVDSECLGGGRINHDSNKSSIIVYGESVGYGRADHAITMRMLKDHYKNYNVTVQDD